MTTAILGTMFPERRFVHELSLYQERDHDPFPQIFLFGTDQKKGASFGHIDGTILTLAGLGSVSVRAGVCSSRGLLKARSDGFGR